MIVANLDAIVHYSDPKIMNEGIEELKLVSSVGFHMTVGFKMATNAVKRTRRRERV